MLVLGDDFADFNWVIGSGMPHACGGRASSSSCRQNKASTNKQANTCNSQHHNYNNNNKTLLEHHALSHKMDRNDRFPLASREPNPLRPYYIPASIGPAPSAIPANTSAQTSAMPRGPRPSPSSYQSNATDLLPDLDLDFRSSAGEAWTNTRALLDTLAWRYASCLMAQPFDVAKTILQVSLPPNVVAASTPRKRRTSPRQSGSGRSKEGSRRRDRAYESFSETDEDLEGSPQASDDDIPDYFTSNAPRSRSPRKRRRTPPSASPSPDPTPTPSRSSRNRHDDPEAEYKLLMKRGDSVMHSISVLYETSGAVGLWRATNCTFLYSILLRTTDSFLRSLLLALFGLPDLSGNENGGLTPGITSSAGAGTTGLDLSDSPSPIASLVVIGLASCLSGLLLSPLDLVRTRLIVTPASHPPRGVLSNLKRLPSLILPSKLWLPTALYHTLPQVFSTSMPQVLRRQFNLLPETAPTLWSLASFGTSLTELFIRLPLETIVRRSQVNYLKDSTRDLPLIVEPAPYLGIGGTIYSIMYSEGETKMKDAKGMIRVRKGQGSAGLVRGWRVGFWGLVGVWGAGSLGSANESRRGEF
jgi:fusion and transport protein UGO1